MEEDSHDDRGWNKITNQMEYKKSARITQVKQDGNNQTSDVGRSFHRSK